MARGRVPGAQMVDGTGRMARWSLRAAVPGLAVAVAHLLREGGDGGAQILGLSLGQGGFVGTVVPEAGRYPLVDRDMRHGESGDHGSTSGYRPSSLEQMCAG